MKIEKSIVTLFGTVLLTLFFCGCASTQFSKKMIPGIVATIEKGQEITSALEEYKNSNGRYPEQLESLIPTYLKVIPEAYTSDKTFSYYNVPEINEYYLHFSLYRSVIIFPKAVTWFTYSPDSVPKSSGTRKVHFVINGWEYVTLSRYEVGQGGRVPDSHVYDWDHIIEWCRINGIECYIP